ncbi:immunity 26/phosphotriesterase HocA family protein [Flavobacterium ginsengiterrae]|uniref:Immunity 26/phosphotriesterase HocA family protein n=1 Tax=Flavobacterium ginsengiterrae TaxID=871695 RepID=A0ABP7H6J1_9FLAO
MENILFELTNDERKYLGLLPVEKNWELIKLKDMYLYFDGDIIRKKITVSENQYLEQELLEKTAENRSVLLPKTAKGKPKKLNFTATQSFSPFGVYFSFSAGHVLISNYTTQTNYFSGKTKEDKTINGLKIWLKDWIKETTQDDLKEIESFKQAKRQNCKFKEGDFFAFKIGRKRWGFGRILLDIAKLRKNKDFTENKNYGLKNLMGKPLIVKVYHKIANTPNINLDELIHCDALPSQAVMDNHFFYGENKIIGNKDLEFSDLEMLISYSKSISAIDNETVYLQYGLIYKETQSSKFDKYLISKEKSSNGWHEPNPYRNEGIGFGLDTSDLEKCIQEKSNNAYWNNGYYSKDRDLRNPKNIEIKREIFSFFGLDADKNYEENFKLFKQI